MLSVNLNLSAPIQNWPDLLRSHRNMLNTWGVLWTHGQGLLLVKVDLCSRKHFPGKAGLAPTFRKGFSFVSMMNSYLHSSQHRVSELLIHCCRQAWCTKWRLPVQWQGVIKGLSSSPSQWHILNQKKSWSLGEEEAERMWKRHVIPVLTHGCPLRILRHTYQRNVFHKGAKLKNSIAVQAHTQAQNNLAHTLLTRKPLSNRWDRHTESDRKKNLTKKKENFFLYPKEKTG